MTGRVQEHPEAGTRLVLGLSGAQLDRDALTTVEILDHQVQVHLLGNRLIGPAGLPVILNLLEGDAIPAALGADLGPVTVHLDLPTEQRAVEGGKSLGVGTVNDETWKSCDSHGTR